MSCGVGCRCGSDPICCGSDIGWWLQIRPPTWEPPYVIGAAQEKAKRQKKIKKRKEKKKKTISVGEEVEKLKPLFPNSGSVK